MTYFLTSMIGPREDKRITSIYRKNLFLSNLKERWKQDSRVLVMPAYPEHPRNDGWIDVVQTCLTDGELSFSCIHLCDHRNLALVNQVSGYDVVVLAGGHVPSQNAFFAQIGLREKLRGFDGILIGISAGSMNCASTVYAHVERPGETVDPNYKRFLTGLAITERMILPHYQEIKDEELDGKRVMEKVAYPDSVGREFICMSDGSYIMGEDGRETVYGEAYSLRDETLTQICRDGQCLIMGENK